MLTQYKTWSARLLTSGLLSLAVICGPNPSLAEEESAELRLGEEYTEYERGAPQVRQRRPMWQRILLYLPNRILDLVDVVRLDAGVGPASGLVLRCSKWGQLGYRSFAPASLRVGLRGRAFPLFVERSAEFGAGPGFFQSHDREVTPLEIGAGADLFIVGGYFGLSFDELFDFLGGWIGVDFKDDDL